MRDQTAELLRVRVAAMNMDNFVVRPQRQFVEKYAAAKAWRNLTVNGVMAADRLFQSPFTDINSQGPLSIFPASKVSSLVDVLADIRQRAFA